MLNKLMIEKFKQCENIINEYDYFNFYTFDEFFNLKYINNVYEFMLQEELLATLNAFIDNGIFSI